MARTGKGEKATTKKPKAFTIFEDDEREEQDAEEELPKDEAGRRKIKRQYEDLLGIRVEAQGPSSQPRAD